MLFKELFELLFESFIEVFFVLEVSIVFIVFLAIEKFADKSEFEDAFEIRSRLSLEYFSRFGCEPWNFL